MNAGQSQFNILVCRESSKGSRREKVRCTAWGGSLLATVVAQVWNAIIQTDIRERHRARRRRHDAVLAARSAVPASSIRALASLAAELL
jgi:hypothetical protein